MVTNPLAIPCPVCPAGIGEPCVDYSSGRPRERPHSLRVIRADMEQRVWDLGRVLGRYTQEGDGEDVAK